MALIEFSFSTVENKSAYGTAMPALRGWPAKFLTLTTTADAILQDGGDDWTATADGFVEIVADAAIHVRFFRDGDATAAGPGAGWPLRADAPRILSYRAGDKIRAKAA